MTSDDIIGYATLVGIVVLFFVFRRKERNRTQAAVASAHAAGRNEMAAEISSLHASHVSVAVHQQVANVGSSSGDGPDDDNIGAADLTPRDRAFLLARIRELDTLRDVGYRLDLPDENRVGRVLDGVHVGRDAVNADRLPVRARHARFVRPAAAVVAGPDVSGPVADLGDGCVRYSRRLGTHDDVCVCGRSREEHQ